MRAFHVMRTHGRQTTCSFADFEVFTLLLSALKWREHHGEIKLVTDRAGWEHVRNLGIVEAWDEIDVSLDEMESLHIDEGVFLAGAKLYALSKQSAPCVMVDLDFIVWRPLDFAAYGTDLAVIHREGIDCGIYPPRGYFRFRDGWELPAWLDWETEPCNAAFVYFGAQDFICRYTDFALEFMKMADVHTPDLSYMVFAEQRWMAMCAAQMKKQIHALSSLPELFGGEQRHFTHIWGHKSALRNDAALAEKFCRDCAARLSQDFPAFAGRLQEEAWAAKCFAVE